MQITPTAHHHVDLQQNHGHHPSICHFDTCCILLHLVVSVIISPRSSPLSRNCHPGFADLVHPLVSTIIHRHHDHLNRHISTPSSSSSSSFSIHQPLHHVSYCTQVQFGSVFIDLLSFIFFCAPISNIFTCIHIVVVQEVTQACVGTAWHPPYSRGPGHVLALPFVFYRGDHVTNTNTTSIIDVVIMSFTETPSLSKHTKNHKNH